MTASMRYLIKSKEMVPVTAGGKLPFKLVAVGSE